MAVSEVAGGDVQRLDPKVRQVWAIESGGPCLALTVVGAAVAAAAGLGGLALAVGVLGVAVTLGCIAWSGAAWRRWRWSAGPAALELRHGVVIARRSAVPYHRIQQIDVVRGPIERLLGLATLTVRTAAATSDASLPGLAASNADDVRRFLLERAGRDDAV